MVGEDSSFAFLLLCMGEDDLCFAFLLKCVGENGLYFVQCKEKDGLCFAFPLYALHLPISDGKPYSVGNEPAPSILFFH